MIVLGIDPGLARMGFGIVEGTRSAVARCRFGCVLTPKEHAQADRLAFLEDELGRLIKTERPDRITIEKLFFQKNVRTALVVGEARGIALAAAARAKVPVIEVSPQDVKLAVTGYGAANKGQVQRMVQILFGLATVPQPDDAADALAIAYTGLVSQPG